MRITPPLSLDSWRTAVRRDLHREAVRDRWGWLLILAAWIHLASFLLCQELYLWEEHRSWHHLLVWTCEVTLILGLARSLRRRTPCSEECEECSESRPSAVARWLVRSWTTFLILALNAAVLNSTTGFEADWFKILWAALGVLGFSVTAALIGDRFLLPAGLLLAILPVMVAWPAWHYLVYGLTWWAILLGIGLSLIGPGQGRGRSHCRYGIWA